MKEILTKLGVEIITEIFGLIIRQSFNESISLNLLEIKTITLCFKYFNEILNKDVQALNDLDQSIRIKLLK